VKIDYRKTSLTYLKSDLEHKTNLISLENN